MKILILTALSFLFFTSAFCQDVKKPKKKKPAPFKWVNPPKSLSPGVSHHTFKSSSMGIDVGYCVYLPSAYEKKPKQKFPVVYYLHGGRPGSESKSIKLVKYIHQAMESGQIKPAIYVFNNGGPVSHYNLPKRQHHMGEDLLIKELIPHIDKTLRTIPTREARGLEGFSQGGRATARIMFKHPQLFSSCAPGGGGYETEKKISENKGMENPNLIFAEGYNTWDLARKYAAESMSNYPLKIQLHVGTKGFNYENNLLYMEFLKSLAIPFEKVIVKDAPHSAAIIYDGKGLEILKFHSDNFTR
jgi:enterochelin esterase-like enzyme